MSSQKLALGATNGRCEQEVSVFLCPLHPTIRSTEPSSGRFNNSLPNKLSWFFREMGIKFKWFSQGRTRGTDNKTRTDYQNRKTLEDELATTANQASHVQSLRSTNFLFTKNQMKETERSWPFTEYRFRFDLLVKSAKVTAQISSDTLGNVKRSRVCV